MKYYLIKDVNNLLYIIECKNEFVARQYAESNHLTFMSKITPHFAAQLFFHSVASKLDTGR